MSLLCFFGLHKWSEGWIDGYTRQHDFYARMFGNVIVRKQCLRCKMQKTEAKYAKDHP